MKSGENAEIFPLEKYHSIREKLKTHKLFQNAYFVMNEDEYGMKLIEYKYVFKIILFFASSLQSSIITYCMLGTVLAGYPASEECNSWTLWKRGSRTCACYYPTGEYILFTHLQLNSTEIGQLKR